MQTIRIVDVSNDGRTAVGYLSPSIVQSVDTGNAFDFWHCEPEWGAFDHANDHHYAILEPFVIRDGVMQSLPVAEVNGFRSGYASHVSRDGMSIFGATASAERQASGYTFLVYEACRWTLAGQRSSLGTGPHTTPVGASADGSVMIVGHTIPWQCCDWDQYGLRVTQQGITALQPQFYPMACDSSAQNITGYPLSGAVPSSEGSVISSDGRVVFGFYNTGCCCDSLTLARFENGQATVLRGANCADIEWWDVNGDGTFGLLYEPQFFGQSVTSEFWDPVNGFQSTWSWFHAHGLDMPILQPSYYDGLAVQAFSDDLSTFVGFSGGAGFIVQFCTSPAVSQSPAHKTICPSGGANFSVVGTGAAPLVYQWQVQTAPNTWVTLGNDPGPLPCGGGAFAYATPINSPTVTIGIRPCPGNPTAPQHFQIRCLVSNACGSVASNETSYTICPADFNCSGAISVQDIFDFLAAYFAGDAGADFNASGANSVQDIFDFLAAYFAGCA